MNNTPIVSVSVVTYQHVNYIKPCLDSILMQQTTFPFEIVLGEDESSDGTREICIDYAKQYPDIIRLFLRQRKDVIYINGRPTGRYNFIETLKACKGTYIALCEGDDYWTDPLKLQKQVDFLESNNSYVISSHNAFVVDENNHIISKSRLSAERKMDFSSDELMSGRQVLTASMCFRNIIKEFPKEFYVVPGGDTFLVSLLGQFGQHKFQKNIKDTAYRIHSRGIWNSKTEKEKLIAKRTSYLIMSEYFRKNGEMLAHDSYFKKYFNVSKALISNMLGSDKLRIVWKLLFFTCLNCFKRGYYRRVFHLLNYMKKLLTERARDKNIKVNSL